jgi:hypothetical protein
MHIITGTPYALTSQQLFENAGRVESGLKRFPNPRQSLRRNVRMKAALKAD